PRGDSRSRRITGRPPERFETSTRAGRPSTCRTAPTANRSGSSLACSTKKEPSRPCGLPTRPTVTSSVDDLDKDAVARARRARADDCAQGARNAALPSDHLADVVLRYVQLQHVRTVALDLLDVDRVGIVDEPPRQLGEQFSQSSSP